MKTIRFIFLLFLLLAMICGNLPAITVHAQTLMEHGVTVPVPISPHGTIIDNTPTFKWGVISGASKYEIQVWTGTTKVLDLVTNIGSCSSTICQKTPSVPLGYKVYKWRTRAYLVTWSSWSPMIQFTITPPSFISNFTLGFGGWKMKAGANWNLFDGYLYTPGTAEQYSSIYYPKGQFTNFDYSARVRGQGEYGGFPCIVLRMGDKLGYESEWYPGYSFCYDNYGFIWASLRQDDGTYVTLIDSKKTDVIVPYDWNILRVVAKGSSFRFYVNGTFAGLVTNNYRSRGYIGVMGRHSHYPSYNEEMDVDWVKLDVIETVQSNSLR